MPSFRCLETNVLNLRYRPTRTRSESASWAEFFSVSQFFLWWVSRLEVSVTVKDIEKRNPVGGHLGRNLIGRSAFDGNEKPVFEQVFRKTWNDPFLRKSVERSI